MSRRSTTLLSKSGTAALLVVLATAGFASRADATFTIDLLWVEKNGLPTTEGPVVDAEPGDLLTLEIRATADADGVNGYSLSVEFDWDDRNELDLVETREFAHEAAVPCDPLIEQQLGPLPDCFNNFGNELINATPGIEAEVESTTQLTGIAESFEAAASKPGPDAGASSITFRVGQIVFRATDRVVNDGDDLEGSLFGVSDYYQDNSLLVFVGPDDLPDPVLVPGFARVNRVPEPSASMMEATSVASIAVLWLRSARRRSRACGSTQRRSV